MQTRHFLLVLIGGLALAASAWAADRADDVEAQKELAAQGYSWAQAALGLRYSQGHGVAQDYAEALKWYRRAAAKGNASAQYNLGVLYLTGQGVARDEVQAYKWLDRAAATYPANAEREAAVQTRDSVAARMTPAQIAEAQKLAQEWKPQ